MLIIDRFEAEYAVCEDKEGEMINILISKLPMGIKEGCCIEKINGVYVINYEETKLLKVEIEKLTQELWK
ncbi:DUF3006 domain-containing protein [Clostridium sp.]|uniref:DUF3006 domain-containing protein n=1 Tax=Clostridium sp. TaxID=1506 RepID=UPI0032162EFD